MASTPYPHPFIKCYYDIKHIEFSSEMSPNIIIVSKGLKHIATVQGGDKGRGFILQQITTALN